MNKHISITIHLVIVLLITSCAASVKDAARANADAKSCCVSFDALPQPTNAFLEQSLQLLPTTPHYNFGLGLAPFIRLTLDPVNTRTIEIRAHPKGSGKLFGGDGSLYYADVKLIFMNTAGVALAYPTPSAPSIKSFGFGGSYTLTSRVYPPDGAVQMLVTTDARNIGSTGSSVIRTPDGGVMVGGAFVSIPGGERPQGYTLVPYGELTLIVNGVPSKK